MKKLLTLILVGLILAALSGCVGNGEKRLTRLYITDWLDKKVYIYDDGLNYVDEFAVEGPDGERPSRIAVDEDYIYVEVFMTAGDHYLYKYNRASPYGLVRSVKRSGASVFSIDELAVDDAYLYAATSIASGILGIEIYKKSDLSFVSTFQPGSNDENTIGVAVDDDYIYTSLFYDQKIKKFDKTTYDLLKTYTFSGDERSWDRTDTDSLFLYVMAVLDDDTNALMIFYKDDLSHYKTISSGFVHVGGTTHGIGVCGNYAFTQDSIDKQVKKVKISTNEVIASADFTGPMDVAVYCEEEQEVFGGYIG